MRRANTCTPGDVDPSSSGACRGCTRTVHPSASRPSHHASPHGACLTRPRHAHAAGLTEALTQRRGRGATHPEGRGAAPALSRRPGDHSDGLLCDIALAPALSHDLRTPACSTRCCRSWSRHSATRTHGHMRMAGKQRPRSKQRGRCEEDEYLMVPSCSPL